MGWAGGGEVFGLVARAMIEAKIGPKKMTKVLTVLIHELQMRDWDTEDESLAEFEDNEAIVEAFRRNDVIIRCGQYIPDGSHSGECSREKLPRGHDDGQHEDYAGRKWPVEPARM